MHTTPITEHFDQKVGCCGSLDPSASLIPLTARLLDELDDQGLVGRTVLEAGCGRGGLLVGMLRRGAARATGIDLSPQAVAAAERLAAAARVGEQCVARVGDAAQDDLAPHDVVVLDRVICCYPDATRLLANTVPAARATYAFVVPVSRGLRGRMARLALGCEDAVRRVRRDPFRAFVHDVDEMHGLLVEAGFALRTRGVRRMWEMRVYGRNTAP